MSNDVTRGLLLVISSPSGAGKTTLARRLAAEFDIRFSVSTTTRSPRTGEVDGKDYCFVTDEGFDQMVANQEFAEWAVVHGNRYGTSIATVQQSVAGGMDCLFDVDYQGGRQIRRLWPDDSVLCFILPPSMEELESRLRRRATDAPEVIATANIGCLVHLASGAAQPVRHWIELFDLRLRTRRNDDES